MWLWILISFKMVSELEGYANGNIAGSCGSMLPNHPGFGPETSKPPFMITCQNCNSSEDPITVTLKSNNYNKFAGFMLEARNASLNGDGPAIGKFIVLDRGNTKLLTCNGPDSAVSHNHNRDKTSVSFNWTAQGADCNIIFRATVVEGYAVYWVRVEHPHYRPTPTPEPTTPEPTTSESPTSESPSRNFQKNENIGLMMMCVENLVEAVTRTMAQCFSRFKFHQNKALMAFCKAACAILAVLSLVFFVMVDHYKVALIALVSVVIVIIFIELVLLLLPLGPSHELKDICDLAHQACCIIHHVFTIAVILLGVVNCVSLCEDKQKVYWLLIVLIAYTVWILLNEIWVSERNVRKKKKLHKNRRERSEDDQHEPRGMKENLCAVKMDVIIAVIFIIGNLLFTAAVIPGLFQCQFN
ncbi:uncharacterized protein LOC121652774 isoform X2 [Melanotaenia boesemani]|nr:uncharacterized protein LOC121652774 isoform X2 [Melanotaenia boesemani]